MMKVGVLEMTPELLTTIIIVITIIIGLTVVESLAYRYFSKVKKEKIPSTVLLHWTELLKRHHVTSLEYNQLIQDLKSIKQVPDKPKNWGSCKTIYYAALKSEELTLEQKQLLYAEFYRLNVSHLPYPRLNTETS